MRAKRILGSFIAVILLVNTVCFTVSAKGLRIFVDDFEDYPEYGVEMFLNRWDTVVQDTETNSNAKLEMNEENGFLAFAVRTALIDGLMRIPNVYIKKNGFDNKDVSMVYEADFYTFDDVAQAVISFSNPQGTVNLEMIALQGVTLRARNAGGVVSPVFGEVGIRQWNRVSIIVDGGSKMMQTYLNGTAVGEAVSVNFRTLDLRALSVQVSVRNHSSTPHSLGRVYMDNFRVYEGNKPKLADEIIETANAAVTYLNRQFTSAVLNGRAHGVGSFHGAVSIIDVPSATNKSALVTLGKDGAYFPFEQPAAKNFTAKIIYTADNETEFFAKSQEGTEQKLFTLPAYITFGTVIFNFDFEKGVCTASYEDGTYAEADLTLKSVARIGFYNEGVRLTLNKLFAIGGIQLPDDSYFKDYSYKRNAITALVTNNWRNTYKTLSQGVFLGIDFYQIVVFGSRIRYSTQPPRVFGGEPYVPFAETVFALGGEAKETDDGIVYLASGEVITPDAEHLHYARDTDYIMASVLADAFDLKLSWDGSCLLGFGTQTFFSEGTDTSVLKNAVHFARPSGEEIFDRIEKTGGAHPRVLANGVRLAEVRQNMSLNPIVRQWYEKLKSDAEKYLNMSAPIYTKPDGIRLLAVSNQMYDRMQTLGIAYKMTGDTRYAEAAWRDLDAVSRFTDWNPSHYLDVGQMSYAVALGYSWFYDYLSDERKDIIAAGWTKHALESYINAIDRVAWWTTVNSNWNPWTHGGILTGIVALSDRLDDRAKYALDRMFPYLEYLYPEFVPDGAWAEGTSYHAITLRYLSMWCETLTLSTGHDFGYWDLPGMDVTAYYGDAISGPGGVFNYGDNTETLANYQAQSWFAYKYNDSALAQLRYDNMIANGFAPSLYDLLMVRRELLIGFSDMQCDMLFSNLNLFSLRTGWSDANDGIFLAAKGGQNGVSHFHYDLGGFVMDVGGQRFAYELGREAYGVTANDTRVHQYKKRAEGHNTYVINPKEAPGQIDTAFAPVIDFQTGERGVFGVIDLTNAYMEARDMKRGFFLTNDRRTLLIQDEVSLSMPSEVYWFMHTQGTIEVVDNGKAVYITKSGVTIRMDILDSDNAGAVFEVRDALPLPTTPWLEGQGRNEAYQKLTIHWPKVHKFTLAVAVSQVLDLTIPVYHPEVVPMRQWQIPKGKIAEKPVLNTITKDGARLAGFSPNKYSYVVTLPYDVSEKPVYGYYADENIEVQLIEEPANITGQTKFLIKDTKSNMYSVYVIMTRIEGYIGRLPGAKELNIVSVEASSEPEPQNPATAVLDGVYETRWAASGDVWLNVELQRPTEIYAVGVLWYLGNTRSYIYEIETSEDGENWEQVFSGKSSGSTTDFECQLLGGVKAKFLRYKGYGHLAGEWNNISEIRVYERE